MKLLILGALSLFLVSCVHYDPEPQLAIPVPSDETLASWSTIPVEQWDAVNYDSRAAALAILGKKESLAIRPEQAKQWTHRELFRVHDIEAVPGQSFYLVRARGYGGDGGRARFNVKSRELYLLLATYNGEMSWPGMRWTVADIPVVISLPSAPTKIHKAAVIAGDSVSRFMDPPRPTSPKP
jgi:hypothetical protein